MESADAAVVDVAEQEVVHGTIPVARVLIPGHGVPPVAVEAAVGEACDFGQDVEDAFPDDVPSEELLDEQREEHFGDDEWKFFPAFVEGHAGFFHSDCAGDGWVDEALRDDHHDA